jgi:hypothetical protein
MKQSTSPILFYSLVVLLFVLIFLSCKKEGSGTGIHQPPVDTTHNPPAGTCSAIKADAENIAIFPADNSWNQDISSAAADPNSSQILSPYSTAGVKADFGSGLWNNAPIGIPYTVVCGSQQKIAVVFRANAYDGNYGNESDPGPYPIPLNTPIEGNGQGDAHVMAVDKENGILYELYNASVNGDHWEASSGAVFNLKSNQLRQDGWTSADAAGLPIFAGLVRYEEILKGVIDHPIRFTLTKSNVKPAYISPATHKVNSTGGQFSLPFGAKIRLKANFDINAYPATDQIILRAMKKYGLILADIGSNMYITGAPDDRWNNDELQQLGKVKASDFEVVK